MTNRHLLRFVLATAGTSLLLSATTASAQPAKALYEQARSRERAARAAQTAVPLPAETARSLIRAYERIARRHPASPYSDDALWRAGVLAAEQFMAGGAEADRRDAERLLRWLVSQYPASSLVRPARARLATLAARATSSRLTSVRASTSVGPSTDAGSESRPAPRATPSPPAPRQEAEPAPSARLPASPRDPEVAPATHPAPLAAASPALGDGAGSSPAPVLVRDIQRVTLPAVVRVIVVLDGPVAFQHRQLADPDRVFFDLVGTEPAPHLANARWSFLGDIIREIRIGRHPPQTTRVVLELERLARYSVFAVSGPDRLLIDFEREPAVSASAGSLPVAREGSVPSVPTTVSNRPGESGTASSGAGAPEAGQPPAAAGEPATRASSPKPLAALPAAGALSMPRAPAANVNGKFSLARQLGLGVGRVVIDPGHGGHDPGAQAHGLSEAALVLDVALRLETLLHQRTAMEVILTRRTDVFVPLDERTAIANREEADLFLSIHANASPSRTARGVETYFLNFAATPDAEAVAARENAAAGHSMRHLGELLKAIALNTKLDESREFARLVQQSLVRRLRPANRALQDLGVKQAPFVVLIGAAMPSVLAEIAFITNATEARLLKSGPYRQRIAEALFDAIVRYQRSLKALATVAEQR